MKAKNNQGVTLIELLVTISLIGILVGVSGDLLFTIFRSFNKSSTIVNIQEEGNAVLNKIKTDAINASSVTVTGNQMTLVTEAKQIIYEITNIVDGYGDLTRTDGAVVENLFNTTSTK